MRCHICGGEWENIITDLPFKVGLGSIVIFKELPVIQCRNCSEYLLEDKVVERVDKILEGVDHKVQLEILTYAA